MADRVHRLSLAASNSVGEIFSRFHAWFVNNGIEEFEPIFLQQGFNDLETVMEISSKNELKEMGIHLLGSQLKLLSKINALKRPSTESTKPPKRLKQTMSGKKRPKNSPSDETPSKKARKETESPISRSASGSSLASRALNEPERPGSRGSPEVGITEEAVRRYLSHKPMTTKDLLKKFKTKKTGLKSEQTVQQIATILKKIVPEQKMIKGKLYLSLKRS